MYESSWLASTDPAILAGTATFKVNNETVVVRLEDFGQFQAIGRLLTNAYANGELRAMQRMDSALNRQMQELFNAI